MPIYSVYETAENRLPKFWRDGDFLVRNTVERFIKSEKLSESEIKILKKYLKQWVNPPFYAEKLDFMSDLIDLCQDQEQIDRFVEMLFLKWGIDPL